MKRIPLYTVTGFLSAGKTRWVHDYLGHRRSSRIAIIYFERGATTYKNAENCLYIDDFSKGDLDPQSINSKDIDTVVSKIDSFLKLHRYKEVIIEWNGLLPLSLWYKLIEESRLRHVLKPKQTIYVCTHNYVEHLLQGTGEIPLQQLRAADKIFIDKYTAESKTILRPYLQGNTKVYDYFGRKEYKALQAGSLPKKVIFTYGLAAIFAIAYLFLLYGAPHWGLSLKDLLAKGKINVLLTLWLGIMYQALPFLVLGTLVSGFIQFIVPQKLLHKLLSQHPIISLPIALICAFCFPVCDCATIPVLRGLLAKKVPLPTALTFTLSAPIINPIVILATYYAFAGNIHMVIGRVLFGALGPIVIGLSFTGYKGLTYLEKVRPNAMTCNCAIVSPLQKGWRGKIELFFMHSKEEFLQVASFLLMGAFLAALMQTFGTRTLQSLPLDQYLPVPIIFMMAIAFILSLCSTSDAMVARSLGSALPQASSLAFLLYGPIMDIKTIFVYASFFPKEFIIRLFMTTTIVTFISAIIYAYTLGGMSL